MPGYWVEPVLGTDLSTWMLFGVKAISSSEKVSAHHLIRMPLFLGKRGSTDFQNTLSDRPGSEPDSRYATMRNYVPLGTVRFPTIMSNILL
jgi:hypothetical protein